ncbi:Protein MAIN-LIKE 2 [Linum perenne]
MRQRSTSLHWSPQYQPFLEGCQLLGVRAVLGHTPCKELVTALIERWRPETNTFHLVPGEATITLEDVEVLIGLPTMGRPLIVSPDERPVTDICEQWLGVQPPPNAIQGRTVRVSWVKRLFDRLSDGATAEVINYSVRQLHNSMLSIKRACHQQHLFVLSHYECPVNDHDSRAVLEGFYTRAKRPKHTFEHPFVAGRSGSKLVP